MWEEIPFKDKGPPISHFPILVTSPYDNVEVRGWDEGRCKVTGEPTINLDLNMNNWVIPEAT